MEEQKYQIGDIVEVVYEGEPNDIYIGKIVSIGIYEKNLSKYIYGVSFNLNGITADKYLLTLDGDTNIISWISKKVIIN